MRHKSSLNFNKYKRGKKEGSLSSSVDWSSERRKRLYGNMFNYLTLFTMGGGGVVLIKSRTLKQVTFLGQKVTTSPSLLKVHLDRNINRLTLVLLHWKMSV